MRLTQIRPLRYLIAKLRFPRDEESIQGSISSIKAGAHLSGPNLWVLVAAIFIASLGLNTNSTAVIIGAMLVSPLMGPIIGFGMGLGTNDLQLVKKSVRNFVVMVLLSVATSTLYFFISPVKEAGSELLGRTSPTIYDVFIAFFGGLAGIIAGSSSLRNSNVIPGVAIATALMPPLCTIGYGLSLLNWQYVFGAFYLFCINCVFISMATYLVVNLLNYPKVQEKLRSGKKKRHVWITVLSILVIAPSIYFTFHIVKKYFYKQNAELFIKNEVQDKDHLIVSSKFDYNQGRSKLELVVVGSIYDSLQMENLRNKLPEYGLKNTRLEIYQGPDSRKAMQGVFDEINLDMQLQSLSIKEMYIKMDSIQRGLNGSLLPDSLQVKIANELYLVDSSLQRLTLQRNFSYNPKQNKNDTMWTVSTVFNNDLSDERKMIITDWLKKRLQPGQVTVNIGQR